MRQTYHMKYHLIPNYYFAYLTITNPEPPLPPSDPIVGFGPSDAPPPPLPVLISPTDPSVFIADAALPPPPKPPFPFVSALVLLEKLPPPPPPA